MQVTIAEVRFSRLYSSLEPVATGFMVTLCCLTSGRPGTPLRAPIVVPVRPVAILAVSESCVDARDEVMFAIGGVGGVDSVGVDGCGRPVSAVQISATGGSASVQGIVNKGLSHLLWVLGSS